MEFAVSVRHTVRAPREALDVSRGSVTARLGRTWAGCKVLHALTAQVSLSLIVSDKDLERVSQRSKTNKKPHRTGGEAKNALRQKCCLL